MTKQWFLKGLQLILQDCVSSVKTFDCGCNLYLSLLYSACWKVSFSNWIQMA